jgi:tRNA pseudouridine13 synthase
MASKRLEIYGHEPVIGDLVLVSDANETSVTTGGRNIQHACPITAENISQYNLDDIVLPMPGFDVIYPANISSSYAEFMAVDEIDPMSMKRKVKDYSLPGAYRLLVARAGSVEAKYYRYDDYEVPLSRSDLEGGEAVEGGVGAMVGVVLQFELGKGSYATMAVREICECQGSLVKDE